MKSTVYAFKKLRLTKLFIHLVCFGYYLYFKIRNNLKAINTQYLPPRNRPRYILAGNHSSGVDAQLLLALLTGRYFRRFYAVVHEKEFRNDSVDKLLLETFDMIPRVGTGPQIIRKMAEYIYQNKTIAIPPEGMTSNKVMKGYTGVMRLYYKVNKFFDDPKIPIIPIVSIGANEAYPISYGDDGKYHPKKKGIIGRFGAPIYYPIPKNPDKEWFREKTDDLMDHIARLALQKGGAIESWKLKKLKSHKKREYQI